MKEQKNILEKLLAYLIPALFLATFVLIIILWYKAGSYEGAVSKTNKMGDKSQTEEGMEEGAKAGWGTEEETAKNGSAAKETGNEDAGQEKEVDEWIANMTLEDKIAQLFVITPEALTGIGDVTAAGESTAAAYDTYPVGGLVYFEGNLASEDQLKTMLQNMQQIGQERTGFPVFLSVDEEGGRVARVANQGSFPVGNPGPMYAIGETGDPQKAYDAAVSIGGYLKNYGFNLDYAPIADVLDNVDNTVIGDRSFSSDPKVAAEMVEEAVKGLTEQGIGTVLKHFPGHGATSEDSHDGYAYNNKSLEELEACEFLPFQSGIKAGADMVMVGHISLPNVEEGDLPASMSELVVTQILREQLGFQGVVITDALNMGAIANNYTSAEAAVTVLKAGGDMLLMPADFEAAYQGVQAAVADGSITEERIEESVRRILKVKAGLAQR